MNSKIIQFVETITVHPVLVDQAQEETSNLYSVKFQIEGFKENLLIEEEKVSSLAGENDCIVLSVIEAGETTTTYKSNSIQQPYTDFIDYCKNITYDKEITLELLFEIIKGRSNIINIYDYALFSEELGKKKLNEFLKFWDVRFTTFIKAIVHSDDFSSWHTPTIYFLKESDQYNVHNDKCIDRSIIQENANRLIYTDLNYKNIIPSDFEVNFSDESDSIAKLFTKACFYFSLSRIFDYSTFNKSNFHFKINGFKTLSYTIDNINIRDMHSDLQTVQNIYEIYKWIYSTGNFYDKIVIARNIISINLEESNIRVSETTFNAIQSNFKYYSRENVKHFVTLRNDLSKILLEQENKISSYVSDFASDFKKSIIPSVTFFISVIAIRAISHQEIFDGFSPNIMKISSFLIVLSIIHLVHSLFFELNQKIHYSERQIQEIKARYSKILTQKELDEIFCEKKNQKDINCFHFARKQRSYHVCMWILSIIVLIICLCSIGIKEDSSVMNLNTNNQKEIVEKQSFKYPDAPSDQSHWDYKINRIYNKDSIPEDCFSKTKTTGNGKGAKHQ